MNKMSLSVLMITAISKTGAVIYLVNLTKKV
jgi:hypothetical protein